MKRYHFIAVMLFPIILLLVACGTRESESPAAADTREVELYADKDVYVSISIPETYNDSILWSGDRVSSVLFETEPDEPVVLRALLIPGSGASAADMCEYRSQRDIPAKVDSGPNRPFTSITYTSGDSSIVERVWEHGSRELIVLQAKMYGDSPSILFDDIRILLETAHPVFKSEYAGGVELISPRNVYLADRLYDCISSDIYQSPTTEQPSVLHRLTIDVNPEEQFITLTDTLTIDFSSTQSDFKVSLHLSEYCTGADFTNIRGNSEIAGDSLLCISDSTRIFIGVFRQVYEGTVLNSNEEFASGGYQIRSPSSFQCGGWFYPEYEYPADYIVEITVPDTTYDIYVPFEEIYSRSNADSSVTVTYESPAGGVKAPLTWAVSDFEIVDISAARSRLYLGNTTDSADVLKSVSEGLADNLWGYLRYEGARLDFIIVESLDTPVFMLGSGCIYTSADVLQSISDCSGWADSLSSGIPVRETMLPAGAAMAFLSRSTYLDNSLKQMLVGWSVYRYASNRDGANESIMLEAFRKYYLYETELEGGTEYALADPLLISSDISVPVIMGKGPLVIEFLSREIPGFVNTGIRTMLNRQRHSGESWTRLASTLNLGSNSHRRELFRSWLYQPGIPCIRVEWADPSGSALTLKVEQLQPGHAFPYGSILDIIEINTPYGTRDIHLREGNRRNIYIGTVTPGVEIISVDINPDNLLPADIVYRKVLLENI